MKSWNGYEIVDEKARKDIEKLQLLTGGETINTIADYNSSKADAIVSTLKGETLVTNSSAAIPPRNLKLFGKSTQESTSGNQLLQYPFSDTTKISNGITITDNGDGSIDISGVSTNLVYFSFFQNIDGKRMQIKAGEYCVSLESIVNYSVQFFIIKQDGTEHSVAVLSRTNLKQTFTVDEDAEMFAYLQVPNEKTVNETVKIMLNKGSTALPWEPYTGGMPSPNPDYPQEIQSLGSGGSIGGKLIGENLIDVNGIYVTEWGVKQENGTRITVDGEKVTIEVLKKSNGIKIPLLKPTKSFYCSLIYTFSDGVEANSRQFGFRTKSGSSYGTPNLPGTIINFVAPEPIYTITIDIGAGSSVNFFAVGTTVTFIRSYLNETVNGFTPYTEQPFTVLTPNGLRGIPLGQTIPGAIKNSPIHMSGVYHDGEQYWIGDTKNENGKDVQRILKGVLDGSNVYGYNWEGLWHIKEMETIFGGAIINMNTHNNIALSNYFRIQSVSANDTMNESSEYYNTMCLSGNGELIRFNAGMFTTQDKEGFKAFFIEHPTEIYVIAKEPIITDTAEQHDVVMNYPNTTIINDAGAYIEVEYGKDAEAYINENYTLKSEHEALKQRVKIIEEEIIKL